jgi:subtilisin-like proprotein convertase family protein
MPFPKAILTKPQLITDSEYRSVGQNITLVGYNTNATSNVSSNISPSPRLLNWVEPYIVSGETKTLFYTEVNTNINVGDVVYISGGVYDSNIKIEINKYKKGSDGYQVLKVDGCKIVLDIDYKGIKPYKDDSLEEFIRVYFIDTKEKFLAANRQITTRGGKISNKFGYGQNNVAFISSNHSTIEEWGRNGGVYSAPGFFVREENTFSDGLSNTQEWNNISDKFVFLGSFSVAQGTQSCNGKIRIMDGNFEYGGFKFKEGKTYKWNTKSGKWIEDPEYSDPIIGKTIFRSGKFTGDFNSGIYGSADEKINWSGEGKWLGGTLLNVKWSSGTMGSNIEMSNTIKSEINKDGKPIENNIIANNNGFGFNYAFGCDFEDVKIENCNVFNTYLKGSSTQSIVESHLLFKTQSHNINIDKAYMESCTIIGSSIKSGELKNCDVKESKIESVKSLNSYFDKSVLKDSTYVGDGVIKILGYDEWSSSEYYSRNSGTYSYIGSPNSKVYKFYISESSFKRMKSGNSFYIKGVKIKGSTSDMILQFFDGKFRIGTWTAYVDDVNSEDPNLSKAEKNTFYKRGYECAAFLSMPEDNAYIYRTDSKKVTGTIGTYDRYYTEIVGPNPNKGYSIDIVVSRHDIFNKTVSIDATTERLVPVPRNYNSGPTSSFIGNNIDISSAYIIDADFESGVIETSDWNSGYHINYNSDLSLSGATHTGVYSISLDIENDLLKIKTPSNSIFGFEEKVGGVLEKGDIVFMNSVDYDNIGMVDKFTLLSSGSSYSTSESLLNIGLVNTKVSSLTMSSSGSAYVSGIYPAISKTGNGSGMEISINTHPIGNVLSITYSAPISNGGSYSVTYTSVDQSPGPVDTSIFTYTIITDTDGSATGVIGSTYAVYGAPYTTSPSSATVSVIFATGPYSESAGLLVKYETLANGAISKLQIVDGGQNYLPGQIYKVEGGSATFSIQSVAFGEIYSYSISNPGEDYLIGDLLEIAKPFDVLRKFEGTTASFAVTGVTVSYFDKKGFKLDLTPDIDGKIVSLTMSNPGLAYTPGEIFAIEGGNYDALIRVDSVTGSMVRLGDTYKVYDYNNGDITLQEIGTNIISGLTGGGIFHTNKGMNRWNHLSKTKIDRSKIKSGIFTRPYITRSLIKNPEYPTNRFSFDDITKIKSLVISDAIFSDNSNILSSALYIYSIFVGGSDIWNDGLMYKSIVNGMEFANGTAKAVSWIDGVFKGGMFYGSRSFNASPTIEEPDYLSNSLWLYYMTGEINVIGTKSYNGRYAWYNGTVSGGEFYKSDWNNGNLTGGLFYDSKFYNGKISGGIIGTKEVDAKETRIYNALIENTTVNNAYVYATDTSLSESNYSRIDWKNGVFNSGVFGSNNDQIFGATISVDSYNANITAIPIKDFKIAIAPLTINYLDSIPSDYELGVELTLKHTYIGDLVINLMAPNGKIINLKKRHSGGSNDNMISSVFTNGTDSSSFDLWNAPYTGRFMFSGATGQGVYYDLSDNAFSTPYIQLKNELPDIKAYSSYEPTIKYKGDRYLVVSTTILATASDPNWSSSATLFSTEYQNKIVEWDGLSWTSPKDIENVIISFNYENGSYVNVDNGQQLVYYANRWLKSYHSNTSNVKDLLGTNNKISGTWKLLVMDDAGIDTGFVDEFSMYFKYKDSYLLKTYKNDAVWENGIFNGGQFVDLAVWKSGKFNGGKFISTYGWEESGKYIGKSALQELYTWQSGEFNGGEFGNASKSANSTWFTGEFNGGTFKGRLWNDGIFTFGEFKGSIEKTPVGPNLESDNANLEVDKYISGDYYGIWKKGIVSEKKDDFVTDKKTYTTIERATKPVLKDKSAKFNNILWLGGIFNHQSGEITNSIWLDGLFKKGKMIKSSFNPFVKRYSDSNEFSKDDSCIWENGIFEDGDFFYSKWIQGKFNSGTASGMIWKDGISGYMNAYNVFWENGIWRNGNWNGSVFEYNGSITDKFTKEILNRGIEWSATSSCHIWNIFEKDVDNTVSFVMSNLPADGKVRAVDSFATDNQDDAGISLPYIVGTPVITVNSGSQLTFNVTINKGTDINDVVLAKIGIVYVEDTNILSPDISITNDGNISVTNPSFVKVELSGTSFQTTNGIYTTNIVIPGLSSTIKYKFVVYAFTKYGDDYYKSISEPIPKGTLSPLTNVSPIDPTIPSVWATNQTISIKSTYTDPNVGVTVAKIAGIIYSKTNTGLNLENTSLSGNFYKSSNTNQITNSNFIVDINNLEGNTKYYYKTWIDNTTGRVYSSEKEFITGALQPEITPDTAPNLPTSQLTIASVISKGSNLKYGYIVWKGQQPPTDNVKSFVNLRSGSDYQDFGTTYKYFSNTLNGTKGSTTTLSGETITLSSLDPGESYNALAFAVDTTYNLKVVSNTTITFIVTTANPVVITQDPAVSDNGTDIELNGAVTSIGSTSLTSKGFIYTKSTNYPAITNASQNTDNGTIILSGGSTGTFNSTIPFTSLSKGTKYKYKAFAVNNASLNSLGDEKIFTTFAGISSTSGLTYENATLKLNNLLIENFDSSILSYGMLWSQNSTMPNINSTNSVDIRTSNTSLSSLDFIEKTGLNYTNTTLYVWAFVRNGAGYSYSTQYSITIP